MKTHNESGGLYSEKTAAILDVIYNIMTEIDRGLTDDRQAHSESQAERKIISARQDIENHPRNIEAGRERITREAAEEFDSLNPSITAIIRDDDIRREREEQERKRKETESRKRFLRINPRAGGGFRVKSVLHHKRAGRQEL